ncbi:OmpA family protein [Paracoccus fistulariae]|nr:OmpA family protein [Paracoccus fistulariae]MDB6182010.1 OmpA family protein [Paracoccus fistulariae]
MRGMISNTTTMAMCLTLMAPQFARSQPAMPMRQAPVAIDAPLVLAQAEQDEVKRRRQERRAERAERRQERAERRKARQEGREANQARRGAEGGAKRKQEAERPRQQREDGDRQRAGKRGDPQQAADRTQRQERRAAEEERRKDRQERQQRREARQQEERQQQERQRARREGQRQEAALATGQRAQQRNDSMQNLSKALQTEIDRGLRNEDLRCLSGGSPPCGGRNARMVTPEGAVVQRNGKGELLLAPRDAQLYRVTNDGRFVRRAAEEDRRQTALSREAAQERRLGENVAALLNGQGRLREERITRQNSRRSDQDFATDLRDALNGDRAKRRDDDDNDLMKALLLGAGALAVGAMLNNNRQVALSSPDRVVLSRPDGSQEIVKDETALLRQPGSTVTTEEFDDGSSRTIVTRADGSKVVTIRDADLRVLRRSVISPDGKSVRLIDDTQEVAPVDLATLPEPAPVYQGSSVTDEAALREALYQEAGADRRFSLGQIRNVPEVRALAAPVNIDAITFDTGSAAISADQARQLAGLGEVIGDAVAENPQEMFLIEGHTDTVGSEATNLALSDRRAESVALALSEYFAVPPENLVVQGYGEQYLSIRSEGDIRENRRASVRRITNLLQTAQEE